MKTLLLSTLLISSVCTAQLDSLAGCWVIQKLVVSFSGDTISGYSYNTKIDTAGSVYVVEGVAYQKRGHITVDSVSARVSLPNSEQYHVLTLNDTMMRLSRSESWHIPDEEYYVSPLPRGPQSGGVTQSYMFKRSVCVLEE